MQFISEAIIDSVITQLEANPEGYDQAVEALRSKQPVIMAYMFSESFRMLSQEEREFMLYLFIVIWKSMDEVGLGLPLINEAAIEIAEDKNWGVFQEAKGRTFRDKLDALFENYVQEDLLAFVEDSLEADDEQPLSPVGREVIFVSLKSIVDCLCKPQNAK